MDETQWLNEGFMLDDAGNLIATSYVDLRDTSSRKDIPYLIKACKREHALENSDTILISPVARFRDEGENLIRDPAEGLAKKESRVVRPLTPEQESLMQQISDFNESNKAARSGFKAEITVTFENVENTSDQIEYGKEWWIYSTAIVPESIEAWAEFEATLDPKYDHYSEIGQPAKFAEALGRMVAEQRGPQSKDGWLQSSIGESKADKTSRPMQSVLHGPVVYSDQLHATLKERSNEAAQIAAFLFTKSSSHTAMREYRFAVLRDGAVNDKMLLKISGMMRDALEKTRHGLVRLSVMSDTSRGQQEVRSPGKASTKVTDRRESSTTRTVLSTKTESKVVDSEGKILSCETSNWEHLDERFKNPES